MSAVEPDTIGFLIVDLARLFRQSFERDVAAEGLELTAGEARTLLYASHLPGIRQSSLAERMRIEPMTLSNFLDRLEARGLVRRTPDARDRRAKQIRVTDVAKPLVERIEAIAIDIRRRAMHGFSSADAEAFRRTLQVMRHNLSDGRELDAA
jgi:MarR family transcriptional regulator, transcriptional regulator for hemolysin